MERKEINRLEFQAGGIRLFLDANKNVGDIETINEPILTYAQRVPRNTTKVVTTTNNVGAPFALFNPPGTTRSYTYQITHAGADDTNSSTLIVECFRGVDVWRNQRYIGNSWTGWTGWSGGSDTDGSWTPVVASGNVEIERVPTVGSSWRRMGGRVHIQTELIVTPNDGFNSSAITLSGLPFSGSNNFLNIDTFPRVDNIIASINNPTGQTSNLRIASWNFQKIPFEGQTRMRIFGSYRG